MNSLFSKIATIAVLACGFQTAEAYDPATVNPNLTLTIVLKVPDWAKTNYYCYTNTGSYSLPEMYYGYLPGHTGGTTNDSDRIGPCCYQLSGMTTVVEVIPDRMIDAFQVYLGTTNATSHIRMPLIHNNGEGPMITYDIAGFIPTETYVLQVSMWNNFLADNYDSGDWRSDFTTPVYITPDMWDGHSHVRVEFTEFTKGKPGKPTGLHAPM